MKLRLLLICFAALLGFAILQAVRNFTAEISPHIVNFEQESREKPQIVGGGGANPVTVASHWRRRSEFEGKPFGRIWEQLDAKLERLSAEYEPPGTLKSVSIPFGDKTGVWITLGLGPFYHPVINEKSLPLMLELPVVWAIETPYRPRFDECLLMEERYQILRKREQ
jgi:hypothetical protein